jgi:hypothetical protein
VFIIFAAFRSNPREAAGLAGALMAIKDRAYGGVLLAVTALGLLAFGAYGLAEALYRRIRWPAHHGQGAIVAERLAPVPAKACATWLDLR